MNRYYKAHPVRRARNRFQSFHWIDSPAVADQKMIQCSAIKLVRTENGPVAAAIFQETLARINNFDARDARECPHTLGRTWGAMRVLADQWCFTIRNNNAHPLVLNNSVLRTKHGSRSSEHIESAISVLIPYVIGKFAYSTDRPYVSCETLASWGDTTLRIAKSITTLCVR